MSEGELKKRLMSLSTEYAKLNETNHYVAGKLDVLQTVEQILDEAKKDFPSESGFGFNDDGTPIYDVFDWFKKWFGEPQK